MRLLSAKPISTPSPPCADPVCIEQRIIKVYLRLALTSYVDDTRSVRLMRAGALEIWLTEVALSETTPGLPPYWLELYSPDTGTMHGRLSCFEFDEDVMEAAILFVQDALLQPCAWN